MSIKGSIYRLIECALAKYTDRIVCISEAELQSALNSNIASREKLELISNGIDVNTVRSAIPKKRSELKIPDGALVIGMVGRLTPQKAPDVFIKAAKLIRNDIPNSFFIIVGSGEQEAEIKSYSEENDIPLLITGWTNNPYSYMKVFDIAILLSRWEGFGLAIAEYMAAEKSIIASRVDAIPTLIEDGVDGLLVEIDNAEQVAQCVKWLLNHPKEANSMKQHALEKVVQKYNINRVAQQHIKLFRQLLSRND